MDIQSLLFLYIIIILSSVIHEYAHAFAAFRQGDMTAKYAGRLTLNPLAHIDPWGTVLMPLMLLYFFGIFFGYAKPVAIILGLFIRFMPGFFLNPLLFFVVQVNVWLGLFNLLPFPPLDGSKLFIALADINTSRYSRVIEFFSQPVGIIIAIFVAMTFLPYVSNFILRLIAG